jgi:predicted heme/steroid binding protein
MSEFGLVCERILTLSELVKHDAFIRARKTGEEANGEIWLSILGEVYDVTKGEKFYGPMSGYGYFAGRDASPCFNSGKFNEEGENESLDDLKVTQLESIDNWRKFYEDQDKYPFVGVLHGTFYNSEGKPTPMLRDIRLRIATMNQEPRPIR